MHLKGAIFDLDGTLLDSMRVWDTLGADYLRSRGIEPRENLKEKFKELSLYEAACYFKNDYGVNDSPEEIMAAMNGMIETFYADEVLPKAGVPEFLKTLQSKNVKMCIATATDEYLVKSALIRNGLLGYFDQIFTCASVGSGKDHPDIYESALSCLKTDKKETIVFEDALFAVKTAKRAGFIVCGIFDSSESRQDEIRKRSDYYLQDFSHVEEILK